MKVVTAQSDLDALDKLRHGADVVVISKTDSPIGILPGDQIPWEATGMEYLYLFRSLSRGLEAAKAIECTVGPSLVVQGGGVYPGFMGNADAGQIRNILGNFAK